MLSLLFTFIKTPLDRTRPGMFYKGFVSLGPFFRQDKIKHTPHFYVRQRVHGAWTPWRDVLQERFDHYINHPWAFHQLASRDDIRRTAGNLSRQLRQGKAIIQSTGFKKIHHYTAVSASPADTVQWIYIESVYQQDGTTQPDTLINLVYRIQDVQPQ